MKTSMKSSLVLAALLVAATATAADIDGKWVGKVGLSEITFEFKAQGRKLTGWLNNAGDPGAIEIKDGKVKGDTISFHIFRTLDEGVTKVKWTGKLAGDELRLQRGAVSGVAAAEGVARRVKQYEVLTAVPERNGNMFEPAA
jgi:hypothetical protein